MYYRTWQTFVFAFCFFNATIVLAQQQSPESGQETLTKKFAVIHSGGYGGPVVKFSSIGRNFATFLGGYGGWFVNKKFMIGGGGFGLIGKDLTVDDSDRANAAPPDGNLHYDIGYGGFIVEYTLGSDKLVHYMFNALIGGGSVAQSLNSGKQYAESGFFIFEPAANVEMNITDFFRIGAGASLRVVTGAETPGISNANLSGLAGVLTFKFGYFD